MKKLFAVFSARSGIKTFTTGSPYLHVHRATLPRLPWASTATAFAIAFQRSVYERLLMRTANPTSTFAPGNARRATRTFRLLGLLAIVAAMLAVILATRPRSATDLGSPEELQGSGIHARWAKGDLVVFVRHAERCDRSHNACLDDPEGITAHGAEIAQTAGQAMSNLGMQNTDVVSSPLVRTVQTSHAMFNRSVKAVSWLQECKAPDLKRVLALKQPRRNLIVVTHSGCIEQYEHQLGVSGTPAAGYASALFVDSHNASAARAMGYLDAPAWPLFTDLGID